MREEAITAMVADTAANMNPLVIARMVNGSLNKTDM
jgi:hypothetical protein